MNIPHFLSRAHNFGMWNSSGPQKQKHVSTIFITFDMTHILLGPICHHCLIFCLSYNHLDLKKLETVRNVVCHIKHGKIIPTHFCLSRLDLLALYFGELFISQ